VRNWRVCGLCWLRIRQVVIFGSFASGQVHGWSDLDVGVIADTDAPFLRRSVELARWVQPRVGVQFLVYTPHEMQNLRARPFIRQEILEAGKTMPLHPQQEAVRWLRYADEDLRMAQLAIDAGIYNQVCFHAQPCVEKCLKALLASAAELLPRTHLLVDLVEALPESLRSEVDDLRASLVELDQYTIFTRYPDALPGMLPEGLPQIEDATAALAVADACYRRTQAKVGA
jgi:HEPN domain-containing protein/predicted nucleotidyltransferase